MVTIHGKNIPTTLSELIDARQTALVIVDVQNDICAREGIAAKHAKFPISMEGTISRLKSVIQAARDAGVLIVYLQNTMLPSYMSTSAPYLRVWMKVFDAYDPAKLPSLCVEGTWGHQIIEDIKPLPNEIIVKKYRPDGFIGTCLDLILRENGIKTMVIAGVVSHGCVEETARSGMSYGYFTVLLEDCVDAYRKDLHEAAISYFRARLDVTTSHETIKVWEEHKKDARESIG